ncbi:MAG: TolC family protein [Carboxydocellales bacterium]
MTTIKLPCKKATVVMAVVLSMSMVFGGFSFAQEEANPVRELSLEKSIELAMENNSDIKQAKLDVEKAEVDQEKANTFADYDKIPGPRDNIEEGRLKKLYPRQAQAALTINKKKADYTVKKVKLGVEKAYYEVLKANQLLGVKKLALQRAQEQVRLAQANFKAGRSAKVDVTTMEASEANAMADVSVYETGYKVAVMNFNKIIGLDIATPVKLTAKLTYVPLAKIDLAKSVQAGLESSVDLVAEREKKAISDVLSELQISYYSASAYAYQAQQIDGKKSELSIKDKEIDMRIAVQQAYLNLRSAEDRIKFFGKILDKQKETVRITTLKYKVGLATNADILDANVTLDDSQEKYAAAIYDFNVNKAKFENNLFDSSLSAAAMAGAQ